MKIITVMFNVTYDEDLGTVKDVLAVVDRLFNTASQTPGLLETAGIVELGVPLRMED